MSPENTPADPPIDRQSKIRWGCVAGLVLGGGLVVFALLPVFSSPSASGRITAATLQASGIYRAMVLYADDHDGKFPAAEKNSNQAFRQLFSDYMTIERSFHVPGSAWHNAAPKKRPDDDIGSPPDYAQCLERGENHWAYVAGLDPWGNHPIIADGFVENQPGTYTDDPAKKGGIWKGQKAIVVLTDGSAKAERISAATHFRVLRTDATTGKSVDIFTREGGLPEAARVLNPD